MQEAEEEAIGWVLRLREAGADDWQAFTSWLEADPRHAATYDRVSLADADAFEALRRNVRPRSAPIIAQSSAAYAARPSPPRRLLFGSVLAAALVASIGGGLLLTQGADVYAVTTRPGEQRQLALADGTRVELNGDSRLLLDHRNPRFAELASGEANFTVTHNAGAPFELKTGEAVLRDVGTSFNVRRRGSVTEVAVAEGAVVYNPDHEAIMLARGDRLRDPDGSAAAERSHVAPGTVAQWRKGQLSFENERLEAVAAEISATSGVILTVAPRLADRRFTGSLALVDDHDALIRRLEPVLDVAAIKRGRGWRLVPSRGTAH